VGVVRDIKHMGLGAEEGPVLYTAYAQKTQDWLAWMALAIRTTSNPLDYVGSVRARIRSIDLDQPVSDIATLEQSLANSTAMPRFSAGLVAGISALALVMAVIGVYGVLAWSIAQRTQEIGIRLALGASPNQIVGHLLGRGLVRVSFGICAGIFGALALTRLLASMLFGVHAYDPATFVAVAITLLGAAAIALWMPARRVMRVDPTVALRFD
jgi:putative ABC transport system permease protein